MLAIEDRTLSSYDGGWAEYQRRRTEPEPEPVAPPPRREKPKPAPKKRSGPSELELLEAQIAERETQVAELERRLSEDWSDVATLDAHRQARDDLQRLLSRWERLFEEAQQA
jgi:ATP-binding cassette subfamily F protein 3